MHGVTIRGVDGKLYWGYHLVGTVRAWTATRVGDTGSLTGTIVKIDTFRASQRPIVFVVQHKNGVWRWPLETLQIEGQSLHATLGQKEP